MTALLAGACLPVFLRDAEAVTSIVAVPSIAALRAIPAASAPFYSTVQVAGGASYLWNSGDTGTDNNFTIVRPTDSGGAGRWNRVNPVPEQLNVSGVANLKDWMDITYGAGSWTYWSGSHTGTDAGPAITAACNWLKSTYGNRGIVYVPNGGSFRVVTPPDPAALCGITIKGDGISASQIIFDNNAATLFTWNAAGGFTGGGIRDMSFQIDDGYPTSTSIFCLVQGDATYQPDNFFIENIYVTARGTSFWAYGLIVDGTARTSPQGARVGQIINYSQFKCSGRGMQFLNAVQWSVVNTGIYTPSTTAGGSLVIAGAGTSSTNSVQVHVSDSTGGVVNLSNASHCSVINSLYNSLTGATSFKNYVFQCWLSTVPGANPFDTTAGTFIYQPLQA